MILYRAEIVHWVCESQQLMSIVEDTGFHHLMKTGRPSYKIPSCRTVVHDVAQVFVNCQARIAKMLQVS